MTLRRIANSVIEPWPAIFRSPAQMLYTELSPPPFFADHGDQNYKSLTSILVVDLWHNDFHAYNTR